MAWLESETVYTHNAQFCHTAGFQVSEHSIHMDGILDCLLFADHISLSMLYIVIKYIICPSMHLIPWNQGL
jgi:hypothetical protein